MQHTTSNRSDEANEAIEKKRTRLERRLLKSVSEPGEFESHNTQLTHL